MAGEYPEVRYERVLVGTLAARMVSDPASLDVVVSNLFGAVRAEGGPVSEWWRRAVLYEVYVRSFADSNGDGIGDLPGVRSRLDYLRDLGVDGIWLTPFSTSPGPTMGTTSPTSPTSTRSSETPEVAGFAELASS